MFLQTRQGRELKKVRKEKVSEELGKGLDGGDERLHRAWTAEVVRLWV